MSLCVGLTGGIGSGKSTVAEIFASHGVPIVDTDKISHQLTSPGGTAISEIRDTFGNQYINAEGALDRGAMRKLVFSDDAARLRLEQLLHPLILAIARSQAKNSEAPYVIIVVPLLFESSNYLDWLDRILTVDCDESAQISRASRRTGMNEAMVRTIMSKQIPRKERIARSSDILINNGTLADLNLAVAHLHEKFLHFASTSN